MMVMLMEQLFKMRFKRRLSNRKHEKIIMTHG
jgi:hypothetical protein